MNHLVDLSLAKNSVQIKKQFAHISLFESTKYAKKQCKWQKVVFRNQQIWHFQVCRVSLKNGRTEEEASGLKKTAAHESRNS